MFRRHIAAKAPPAVPAALPPVAPTMVPALDASATRRAAQTDLLAGIGSANESNIALGRVLRDAVGVVDEMTAFSAEFDGTAELTRTRADSFAASVDRLQSQADLIEERLAGAADSVAQAHGRSRAALGSVEELIAAIGEIERAIKMIAGIAAQTNLLALNATIEAARAGAAGAGFRVVAGEVKALSQQTERATQEIAASVQRVRGRAQINMSEVHAVDGVMSSLDDVFKAVSAAVTAQGEQTREIGVGSDEIAKLAQKVRASAGRMRDIGGAVHAMTASAETASDTARAAFQRLSERASIVLRQAEADGDDRSERWPVDLPGTLWRHGERHAVRLIALSSGSLQLEMDTGAAQRGLGEDVEIEIVPLGTFMIRPLTPTMAGFEAVPVAPSPVLEARIAEELCRVRMTYQPYVDRVQAVTAKIKATIEQALAKGAISEDDVFDTRYVRDGATEPAQYRCASAATLEAPLRDILEHEIGVAPLPDFCILQDRNGYNPVHNLRYSKPPRLGDTIWNLRNARARRIFDDGTGLAASRNLKPFLVQSYARDMGDAIELRMEFDAPLFVRGRHWGAVRMAYKLR